MWEPFENGPVMARETRLTVAKVLVSVACPPMRLS